MPLQVVQLDGTHGTTKRGYTASFVTGEDGDGKTVVFATSLFLGGETGWAIAHLLQVAMPLTYGCRLGKTQVVVSDGGPALCSEIGKALGSGLYGKCARPHSCGRHGERAGGPLVLTPPMPAPAACCAAACPAGPALQRRCYWHAVVKSWLTALSQYASTDSQVGDAAHSWVRHIMWCATTPGEATAAMGELLDFVEGADFSASGEHHRTAVKTWVGQVQMLLPVLTLAGTAGGMGMGCLTTSRNEGVNGR